VQPIKRSGDGGVNAPLPPFPDGAVPSEEVESEEHTKNLYQLLDTTASGIAEWILPLVLAANLEAVHWVRPASTIRLIPTGEHKFHVGAWIPGCSKEAQERVESFLELPATALVKVDWSCRYYSEDGSCVPRNELMLAQPLQLTVTEGPSMHSPSSDYAREANSRSASADIFALDVCLDYFACLNPFIADIENLGAGDVASALIEAVVNANLYNEKEGRLGIETIESSLHNPSHRSKVLIFRRLLRELLEAAAASGPGGMQSSGCIHGVKKSLLDFYDSQEAGIRIIDGITCSVQQYSTDNERQQLVLQMAVEAIPNLTMPHNGMTKQCTIENDFIQNRLDHFRKEISTSSEPFVITISRSSDDGFTPLSLVENLQFSVLEILHQRYCGCTKPHLRPPSKSGVDSAAISDCRFDLIFDYGDWEGSTFAP